MAKAAYSQTDIEEARLRLRCRASLAPFVRFLWPVINPGVPLEWSWHLDALCAHLEAVSAGRERRIIFNVPPGSTKSSLISIMWPCWEWLAQPGNRWICASYDLRLSTQFNMRRQAIIRSGRYQWLRPGWELRTGQREKILFMNDQWGSMRAVSTLSGVTGDHADRLVVDDPLATEGIYGPELEQHVRWWDETASSRFRDLTTAAWVVVMQRLHAADLTGHLLEREDPETIHVEIQAEYESGHGSIPEDPRTVAGESFFPARFPVSALAEQKKRLGALQYSAQYQQSPSSASGNVIDDSWWKRWSKLPDLTGAVWIGTWDCAYEAEERSDYTVGQVWAVCGAGIYLCDQVRGHLEFTEMEAAALRLAARWPLVTIWDVEQRALGEALMSRLRAAGLAVRAFKSQSTKAQRLYAAAPYIERGQVWLPSDEAERPECLAPRETWLLQAQMAEFLKEFREFPRSKYDDQVDAAAMAIGRASHLLADPSARPKMARPMPRQEEQQRRRGPAHRGRVAGISRVRR